MLIVVFMVWPSLSQSTQPWDSVKLTNQSLVKCLIVSNATKTSLTNGIASKIPGIPETLNIKIN